MNKQVMFVETNKTLNPPFCWDAKEYEAHQFAKRLLMPVKFLLEAINDKGVDTIKSLCEYFEVEERIMKERLTDLGVIDSFK